MSSFSTYISWKFLNSQTPPHVKSVTCSNSTGKEVLVLGVLWDVSHVPLYLAVHFYIL